MGGISNLELAGGEPILFSTRGWASEILLVGQLLLPDKNKLHLLFQHNVYKNRAV